MAKISSLMRKVFKVSVVISALILIWQIATVLLEREDYIKYSRRQIDPDEEIPITDSNDDERTQSGHDDVGKTANLTSMPDKYTTSMNIDIDMNIDIERMDTKDVPALFKKLVIVTAISQNHLDEAKGMISSAQRHMPKNKIIVYDLGIDTLSVLKVKKMCNVQLRRFPFGKYPGHVKNIHTYAWKPLIIKEALKEFGVIFYGDSSVRFHKSLQNLFPYLKRNHGFMQHIHSFTPRHPDGQYYMTHPQTFKELKIKRSAYFRDVGATPWISAGRVLHVNSSYIQKNLIEPMVNCALRSDCISPKGAHRGGASSQIKLPFDVDGLVPHSHRFDSSVLSLLVYKNMRRFYNIRHHDTPKFDEVVSIARDNAEIMLGVGNLKVKPHC